MNMNYRMKLISKRLVSIFLLAGVTVGFFAWYFGHLKHIDNGTDSIIFSDPNYIPQASQDSENDYFIRLETSSSLNAEQLASSLKKTESKNVKGVYNTSLISSSGSALPDATALADEGYHTTSLPYDASTMRLSVMNNVMDLDSSFSLRKKTVQKVSYVQDHDYAEFEAVYTDTEVDRPLVELYMGYILVDN